MKPTRQIHDPYHNPFYNRFQVPVHSRLDEMLTHTHMVWLNEPAVLDHLTEKNQHLRHSVRALAGAFAMLLVVICSATMLSN